MENTKKTSRQLQAEAMKEKLQQIVQKMSTEKPLDEIRMKDIADAANISVGNFYQYFSSKEEALIYSYKVKDQIWKTLEFEKIEDPLERLQYIFVTHMYAMVENSLCFDQQLYISQLKIYEGYFFSPDRYFHQIIKQTIKECQEQGLMNTKHDPRETMIRLLHFSRGEVFSYCIQHAQAHEVFLPYALETLEEYMSLFVTDPSKLDLKAQLEKIQNR